MARDGRARTRGPPRPVRRIAKHFERLGSPALDAFHHQTALSKGGGMKATKALLTMGLLYGGVVAVRNALYDRDFLKTRRLNWPVVSIGNIRAGGTGKTPFIIHLGNHLQERGVPFVVLSRGYGRSD